MKPARAFFAVIIAILIAGVAADSYAGNAKGPIGKAKSKFAPDEVLVKFRDGVGDFQKGLIHARHGGKPDREIPGLRLQRVKIKGMTVDEAIDKYASDPDVEYAEPNYEVTIQAVPNDPGYGSMWALNNTGQSGGTPGADIDAQRAWDITVGNPGAVVAVIDTGIDYNHPDLRPNLWVNTSEIPGNGIDDDGNGYVDDVYGINTITGSGNPMDDHGHGTHCAGTIGAAGNNGVGIVGINWNVKIMACKFIGSGGTGQMYDAIECLNYVRMMKDRGVPVVATSNSWGSLSAVPQSEEDAIRAQRDIIFVAAAGNNAKDLDVSDFAPAEAKTHNVISVAATDRNDTRASFSNYGRHSVFLGAPGVDIYSTTRGGGYGNMSGTSMATPHVTGVVALVAAANPSLPWYAVRNLVIAGGDVTTAMTGKTISGRRLNAYGSMTCSSQKVFDARSYPKTVSEYVVGQPFTLSAYSVDCANADGPVTVSTASGQTFTMQDDGTAPDGYALDGNFTLSWTPTQATDRLTFTAPGGSFSVSVPRLTIVSPANTEFLDLSRFVSLPTDVQGGLPPYTFAVTSGALPAGMALNRNTGTVSGSPAAQGKSVYTLTATDAEYSVAAQAYTAVVDPDGGQLQSFRTDTVFLDPNESISSVAQRASGNLLLTVNAFNEARGAISQVVEATTSGGVLWSVPFTTGTNRSCVAAAEDGYGDIYALSQTDFPAYGTNVVWKVNPVTGGADWQYTVPGNGPVGGGDGGSKVFAVSRAGETFLTLSTSRGTESGQAIETTKITPAGAFAWKDVLTSDNVVGTYSHKATRADVYGNIYVLGNLASTDNNTYVFLRKIQPSGTTEWTRTYMFSGATNPTYATAQDLSIDPAGEAYLFATGNSYGTTPKAYASVFRVNPAGNVVWENGNAPMAGYVQGYNARIIVDDAGRVHVVGSVYDNRNNNLGQFVVLTFDQYGNYGGRRLYGNAGVDESVTGADAYGYDGLVLAGRAYTYGSGNGTGNSVLAGYYLPAYASVYPPSFYPPPGSYSYPVGVTLSTPTEGAVISYTTDGSSPTPAHGTAVSSGTTITIDRTTTLRAVSYLPGGNPAVSPETSGTYTLSVFAPSFSLAGGTYYSPQTTTVSTPMQEALIRYTTDGSTPSRTNGTEVTSGTAIAVTATVTIKAMAYLPGSAMDDSSVTTVSYVIAAPNQVATPTFSLASGTYYSVQTTTVSTATAGAVIRYTTDGSTPSRINGTQVASGTAISVPASVTLKAMAYIDSPAYTDSPVTTVTYTISAPAQVAAPAFSPAGGGYTAAQTVTVTTGTADARIRYTTDGSTPSRTNGTEALSGAVIAINRSTTLKAMAYIDNPAYTDSPVTSATYTLTAVAPAFSLNSGTYYSPQTTVLTTSTYGARIRYTTDGSTPGATNGIDVASGFSLAVDTSVIVKAIAYMPGGGWSDSPVTTADYNIVAPTQVASVTFSLAPGTYYSAQTTTVSTATIGALIRYTTDGSAPSRTNGTEVQSGSRISVDRSMTVKAMAYIASPAYTDSPVTQAAYTISSPTQVAGPTFSLAPGTYYSAQTTTVSTATTGALIRYTTDGSTPSRTNGTQAASGTVISVPATVTIRAMAYVDSPAYTDSPVTQAVYTISSPTQVATPSITPAGGTYYSAQTATLSCATAGALIRYTTDGSTPSRTNGTEVASGATVPINRSMTIRAMAYISSPAFTDSPVAAATYDLASTAVAFSLPGGTYIGPQTTTLSTPTPGALIRYTTNGTTPSRTNGIEVPNGTQVMVDVTTTVRAMAYVPAGGWTDSPVSSASYTINPVPTASSPTYSLAPGTYYSAQNTTLSTSTPGAVIRYTTDGSAPSRTNGTEVASGYVLSVTRSVTVRAMAYVPAGGYNDSPASQAAYTLKATAPTFTPAPGTYKNAQTITLRTTTPGAVIRYTTNGTTPTRTNGTQVSSGGTVRLNSTTTLRAIAFLPDGSWTDSDVTAGTYTIRRTQ